MAKKQKETKQPVEDKKEEKKEAVAVAEAPAEPKPDPATAPEANNSGAPKNFMIRCPRCCWARVSSGLSIDMTDIHEVKPNCKNCGKWRKFQCPKCGNHAVMKRLKGNT